ncbi:glycosyltransferase family 4 protein [Xenorhabdus sp. DI]|uniref:glycosyltransferase family 4 protein n=1 Tax=Xenorhabdus doucetiae TaxID=351671 RepID=UPI001984E6B8|nr:MULTISPECIES: glycosyltransferase family 4 protein [unclassified Xenorhabdus]MBD2785770.1 glycosyltransferase family 4 protein [Xenorhabdus sp. 3]MBD2789159.1 glycosyltransferase family 4 protein [Xenorhabdus sp. DI]
MRLAIIVDDYLPYSTRVAAKMMHELALEFSNQGHEPIVITPNTNNNSSGLVTDIIDGIQVIRFPSGRIKNVSMITRAFNESLLSIRAWSSLKKTLKSKKIDGIIYYSPSIFFGNLVHKIKNIWDCPSYLILRDSFPQWVIDEGLIKEKSIIAKYFRHFERKNHLAANYIGLMSQKNLEIFHKNHPQFNNIEVLYNWANFSPKKYSSCNIREKLNLSDKIIYFYGGNIGKAQDIGNLLRLANKMKTFPDAHFLFIGQGDEVSLLKEHKKRFNLDNITYLPSISQEEFKKVLLSIDIGLFSLSQHHKIHNFPGKLLGYMVNSIPILGSVNHGNDLMEIVNESGAGLIYINGDDEKLFNSAVDLLQNEELRRKIGKNAFNLLKDKFSVQSAAKNICDKFI